MTMNRVGRVGITSLYLALFLAFSPAAGAQDVIQPPNTPPSSPNRPVRSVKFIVQTSASALRIDREQIPGSQDTITRVGLKTGEPMAVATAPGFPILPYYIKLVALPQNAKVHGLMATPGKTVVMKDVQLVAWSQLLRPGQNQQPRPPVPPEFPAAGKSIPFFPAADGVGLDPAVLQSPHWPLDPVSIESMDERAGYQVLRLRVSPLRWNPIDRSLTLYTDMAIELQHTGGHTPRRRGPFADVAVTEELRALVVNPWDVSALPDPGPRVIDARYLIITDNYAWNENMERGALLGDQIGQFGRLAAWKTQKGIPSAVVSISDILDGVYGDFRSGASDLQEVIRAFLKHARRRYDTYWVLLGGSRAVIPPRMVVSNAQSNSSHWIAHLGDEQPPMGRAHWDAGTSSLRVHADWIAPDTRLSSARTGVLFGRVSEPSVTSPGWTYMTSEDYSSESRDRTEFVVVRGDTADLENSAVYLLNDENLIPTDLYFASVDDARYGRPGIRDWDADGDGIYGRHIGNRSIDGVSFEPDLAVGRAPVETRDEAAIWVNKVIAYETHEDLPANFGGRLLLVAANWGGNPSITRFSTETPVPEGRYRRTDDHTSILHFNGAPGWTAGWRLVAKATDEFGAVFVRLPDYSVDPSLAAPGYTFCTDVTCATPSVSHFSFGPWAYDIPIPTRWVKVVERELLRSNGFYFDSLETDGSILHKEAVRNIFASAAPRIDRVRGLYQDIFDVPDDAVEDVRRLDTLPLFGSWNEGWNIFSLSGHGSPSGCCFVDTSWAGALINNVQGGVLFAASCLTNRFSEPDFLGRALLKSGIGGVNAYIGHSGLGWISGTLEEAFWRMLEFTPMLARLVHMKSVFLGTDGDLWHNYTLNLMGDPEMRIWRGPALTLTVEGPRLIEPGRRLRVRVLHEGAPLEGATVAITSEGILEVGFTEGDGFASVRHGARAGTILTVTVTAPDFKPVQTTVIVVPRFSPPTDPIPR